MASLILQPISFRVLSRGVYPLKMGRDINFHPLLTKALSLTPQLGFSKRLFLNLTLDPSLALLFIASQPKQQEFGYGAWSSKLLLDQNP